MAFVAPAGDHSDLQVNFYHCVADTLDYVSEPRDRPLLLIEYAHAMGNSSGDLMAYWKPIYEKKHLQGGFVWDWVDQGLAKTDDAGRRFRINGFFVL